MKRNRESCDNGSTCLKKARKEDSDDEVDAFDGTAKFGIRNQNRRRLQLSAEDWSHTSELDQFYTKECILKDVIIPVVKKYVNSATSLVDFSCGKNQFISLLNSSIRKGTAYDIAPTHEGIESGAIAMDWFKVKSLPRNACIGLNPPFGYRGNIAQKFIDHALTIGRPQYLFLILPIRKWNTPGYVEIEKVKLPLNAFLYLDGKEFSYPSFFHVFKLGNKSVPTQEMPKDLPGFTMITHASHVDRKRTSLIVRRVGYYAGRQFYIILNSVIYYFHKGEVRKGVSWTINKHNIDNSFWVIYFPQEHLFSLEQMTQYAKGVGKYMDEHAVTTREEDVKRALSINKSALVSMLISVLPAELVNNRNSS